MFHHPDNPAIPVKRVPYFLPRHSNGKKMHWCRVYEWIKDGCPRICYPGEPKKAVPHGEKVKLIKTKPNGTGCVQFSDLVFFGRATHKLHWSFIADLDSDDPGTRKAAEAEMTKIANWIYTILDKPEPGTGDRPS